MPATTWLRQTSAIKSAKLQIQPMHGGRGGGLWRPRTGPLDRGTPAPCPRACHPSPSHPGLRAAATQPSAASAVIALRPSGCATAAPRPVLAHTHPHTLPPPEAALPSWARQPVIAITRALLIPPSLGPLPLSLPACRPSRIAVRGRSLPLHQASQSAHNPLPCPSPPPAALIWTIIVHTYAVFLGSCFLLPNVLFILLLPPFCCPENAYGPPPHRNSVAMSTEVSQSLAAAMARPQIGIDRLPARRVSNEPREAMNCKSCRKRKVLVLSTTTTIACLLTMGYRSNATALAQPVKPVKSSTARVSMVRSPSPSATRPYSTVS